MKKILLLTIVAALTIVACDRDDVNVFDSNDAGIYFQYGGQTRFFLNIDQYYDSTTYTFSTAADTVTQHVISARLRTMGKVRDYDRKVRLLIDETATTGTNGVDFKVDLDNVVIPAGTSEVQVPVTFFRKAGLRDNALRVMLKVEPNENFIVPFTEQNSTNVYYASDTKIMADRFLMVVDEFYTIPMLWTYYGAPLGAWTVKKQKTISDLLGYTAYDWSEEGWSRGDGKVLPARFPYIALKTRNYLQEMADNGTPVLDEDGSYMQLGTGYEVDYSRYY